MAYQVGTGVANDFHAILVLGRDDLQLRILLNQFACIHQPAIDLACDSILGQSWANRSSHLHDGDGTFKFALRTIGQCDL